MLRRSALPRPWKKDIISLLLGIVPPPPVLSGAAPSAQWPPGIRESSSDAISRARKTRPLSLCIF